MIETTPRGRAALLADVGGTNARFALLADGKLGPITHFAVGDYASFLDALAVYLGASAGPKSLLMRSLRLPARFRTAAARSRTIPGSSTQKSCAGPMDSRPCA